MLRSRASTATGEAIARQESSLNGPDHEAQDGQAYEARDESQGRYGQAGSERVAPGGSPRRGVFFATLLQAAGSKFHFLSTRCPSSLVTSSTHFFASSGLLCVIEGGYRVGRDDVEVGWDRHDLHPVSDVGGVVARVAEGGVGVPDDDPVDGCPHVGLPARPRWRGHLSRSRPRTRVRFAQYLQGVICRRHVFLRQHELHARLGHVTKLLMFGRIVTSGP